MKNLIFVLFICASCAIKPVCHLDNQIVKITGYHKSTKTVNVESLTGTCMASFTCYQKIHVGDTVFVKIITPGSVSGNYLPICKIRKK
jgi:hypothetical protein